MNFCVHINECLLTENTYFVWFTSAQVFCSSASNVETFFIYLLFKKHIYINIFLYKWYLITSQCFTVLYLVASVCWLHWNINISTIHVCARMQILLWFVSLYVYNVIFLFLWQLQGANNIGSLQSSQWLLISPCPQCYVQFGAIIILKVWRNKCLITAFMIMCFIMVYAMNSINFINYLLIFSNVIWQ